MHKTTHVSDDRTAASRCALSCSPKNCSVNFIGKGRHSRYNVPCRESLVATVDNCHTSRSSFMICILFAAFVERFACPFGIRHGDIDGRSIHFGLRFSCNVSSESYNGVRSLKLPYPSSLVSSLRSSFKDYLFVVHSL